MIDAASIAKALGGKVRGGRVYAPGPGHSNKDKSLVVFIDPAAPEGFRVHSFAKDDWRDCLDYVRGKLGLPSFNGRADTIDISGWHAKVYPKKEQPRAEGPAREVVAYDYVSADGEVLYQAVRYEPKDFRQRRPNGAGGGWVYSLEGVQRVLYRLPDLLAHPDATVFFTEGEKDADRLAALGHCATTVAGSTWGDADPAALVNRDVLILEDNDAKGRERAAKAAERITQIAKTTRIVRLPGLPERGDVSDFLDADPSHADDLVELCFAAPVIHRPSTDPGPFRASKFTGTAPAREWVVKEWVAKGVVNSLYGAGGVGKTLLAQQLAYCLGIGMPFIGIPVDHQKVLCVLCEDDEDELHRRHDSLKRGLGITIGNPFDDVLLWPRIGYDNLLVTWNANGDVRQGPAFAAVRDEVLKERPDLLILDTLADFFGGNEIIRPQVNHFLKTLLGGLIVEAGEAGHILTVLLLAHPSASGMNTGTGTSGSTAWENAVRARLYMRKPADGHQDERELVRAKANYTTSGDESIVRLLWQDGLFVVVGIGKEEGEINSAKNQIKDNVRTAWDSGKPFTGKKGHERCIWAKLCSKLNHVKRTVFVQAIRQLIDDGEIVLSRRGKGGAVKGYKVSDQGDDDGAEKYRDLP